MSSIDTMKLASMMKSKRGSRGLRDAALEIGGVSASTLSRIEQGKLPDIDTYIRICSWLGVSTEEFVVRMDGDDQRQTITAHLRAPKELDKNIVESLLKMITVAYREIV